MCWWFQAYSGIQLVSISPGKHSTSKSQFSWRMVLPLKFIVNKDHCQSSFLGWGGVAKPEWAQHSAWLSQRSLFPIHPNRDPMRNFVVDIIVVCIIQNWCFMVVILTIPEDDGDPRECFDKSCFHFFSSRLPSSSKYFSGERPDSDRSIAESRSIRWSCQETRVIAP